jgi:hypothetical protein
VGGGPKGTLMLQIEQLVVGDPQHLAKVVEQRGHAVMLREHANHAAIEIDLAQRRAAAPRQLQKRLCVSMRSPVKYAGWLWKEEAEGEEEKDREKKSTHSAYRLRVGHRLERRRRREEEMGCMWWSRASSFGGDDPLRASSTDLFHNVAAVKLFAKAENVKSKDAEAPTHVCV